MPQLKHTRLRMLTWLMIFANSSYATMVTFSPSMVYEHNGQNQTLLLETIPQDLSNQYADLGRSKLGISTAQQTIQTPSLTHLILNQLLLNLSWHS